MINTKPIYRVDKICYKLPEKSRIVISNILGGKIDKLIIPEYVDIDKDTHKNCAMSKWKIINEKKVNMKPNNTDFFLLINGKKYDKSNITKLKKYIVKRIEMNKDD